MAIIMIVSVVVVVLCIVGVVIGINRKNTETDNESQNKKIVTSETTTAKETQTDRSTEETSETAFSTEDITEESSTEIETENAIENDIAEINVNEEENKISMDDILAAVDSINNSPQQEHHNEVTETKTEKHIEDYVVYKADGSVNLNESYWGDIKEATTCIGHSTEMENFHKYVNNKYNWSGKFSLSFDYFGSKYTTYNVYSFSYTASNSDGDTIKFYYNGTEFVEK